MSLFNFVKNICCHCFKLTLLVEQHEGHPACKNECWTVVGILVVEPCKSRVLVVTTATSIVSYCSKFQDGFYILVHSYIG